MCVCVCVVYRYSYVFAPRFRSMLRCARTAASCFVCVLMLVVWVGVVHVFVGLSA